MTLLKASGVVSVIQEAIIYRYFARAREFELSSLVWLVVRAFILHGSTTCTENAMFSIGPHSVQTSALRARFILYDSFSFPFPQLCCF